MTLPRMLMLAFCAVLVFPLSPAAQPSDETAALIDHYQRGMAAAGERDFASYAESMAAALEYAPGHPAVMRHLARALAQQDDGDGAIALLFRVAASGADLGIAGDENFAALRGRADFLAVIDLVATNQQPSGDAEVAFRLEAADLLPEGIAYDPEDDVFYIGSVRHAKIVRLSRTGLWKDFIVAEDMGAVLGLHVDAGHRRLWAVTARFNGLKGLEESRVGETSVFCINLDSERVERRWDLSNTDAVHAFNDIVIATDGRAWMSDTDTGAIYTIAPGGDLEVFMGPQTARGGNGIVLSADETLLYVSQYGIDIVVVDLDRKTTAPIDCPDDVVVCGIDGLYLHNGSLVAVQNYLGMQQVTQFVLSGDGRGIVTANIAARQHPRFSDPTTGAFIGNEFYVIANSQIPRVGPDGVTPPADTFDDTFILRVTIE